MKILDFLCPGDWQDSYDSRVCTPITREEQMIDRGSLFVESFKDLCNTLRWFNNEDKNYWKLFSNVYLYLDGSLFGEYDGKELTVYAPMEYVGDKIRYPFGNKDIKVPVV